MNLREYLKKIGGAQTFYNVYDFSKIQEERRKKRLERLIRLKSKRQRKKIAEEIRKVVFKSRPKGFYAFVSDRIWYPAWGGHYRLAAIVTISIDKKIGKKEFLKEAKKSEQLRKEKLTYVKKRVNPFLKKLMKSESVLGCILRGDLVDPARFPLEDSDIDIIVLTNFRSQDTKNKKRIVKLLKKAPVYTILDYYKFFDQGNFSARGKTLVRKKSKEKVEFSVISLPDFEKTREIWKTQKRHIREYEAQNFPHAKVLFEKKGFGKKFLKMFLSMR